MTILIDTGVLYADQDLDASRHDDAAEALDRVYDGEFGQPYVSDYVYDEAVTLTLKRSGSFAPAKQLGEKLRGIDPYPSTYEILHVSAAVFTDAVDVFEQYDDQALSFTDATTVALYRRHDLDYVMSFDDDFDGLVTRIDPA
ncbi:type II toxin-antitoxin system VapC family toxin [Halopiger goleimassiliensis]|uniref:type II toxin-antitoxin system VapC family toxin n=1 Tax=Halopiger goleimassiliensis TaxID=1293048 RepID=UPI0006783440|nr:type II toxin-antitoxin system VapC family toxin [Halopiger goleimassiliensis]